MKTKLLFITAIFYSTVALCQTDDQQWYIINQFGKLGEETSLGTDTDVNTVGNAFTIEGVTAPDINNESRARNDLFIIFQDGNHYSSRFVNRIEPFFAGPETGILNHHFTYSYGKPISYAYMTNKYEEDDLPRTIRVKDTPTMEPAANPIVPNVPALLSASHNVVFNRDVTVVVNYEMLRRLLRGKDMSDVSLRFSGWEMIDGPDRGDTDIFDPSPVFVDAFGSSTPGYPIGSLVPSWNTEEVVLVDGPEKYRYINLRTTENALQFAPRDDSSAQYNAVFSLLVNGSAYSSIQEEMTFAYDPNFIRVDSICKNSKDDYFVYYHLEFENTGEAALTDYKATFRYGSQFDFSCFEVLKWSAAGASCEGQAIPIGGTKIEFDFNCNTSLFLDNADPQAAIAYVEFRVKIPAPYDVENPSESIRFSDPKVNFAGVEYDIDEFRDKIVADSNANKAYRPVLISECNFCSGPSPSTIDWSLLFWISLALLAVGWSLVFFVKPGWLRKKPVAIEVSKP